MKKNNNYKFNIQAGLPENIYLPNRAKAFCFLFLFLISGCAGTRKITQPLQAKNQKPVFYPPEPEKPRLQFLASFSSSGDLESSPGAFRKFLLGEEKNSKPIVKPYGIAVFDNKIYVCDTVHNGIDILDLEKKKFEYFRPVGEAQLFDPINLCFSSSGDMYVADARRGQVVIFDKDGNYSGAIGKKSEYKPTDVLIRDDKIYICDLKTHSVKIFGLHDRQYQTDIPRAGDKEEEKLFSPTNIALDEEGNLYVSDTGAFRVQKYAPNGKFLMSIGTHGDTPGQFARPKGIAVDKESRIYVVDAAFENIQIFDKGGKLLLFFAEPRDGSVYLVLPAGVEVDYTLKDYFAPLVDPSFEVEYLVLATSQYGGRKLSIFGFGHKKSTRNNE